MKKRSISLLLAGALALTLIACAPAGEGPGPSLAPAPSAPASAEPSGPALATPAPEASVEPTPSPEPSAPPNLGADLPDRDYQPWQTAYMDFLTALLQAELDTREDAVAYAGLAVDQRKIYCMDAGEELGMIQVMAMMSETYSLYDVDKDGVPELFVKYGNCEAAYTTQCYTFRDGQVVCIGEFRSGHSGLYTCPGKSAVVRSEGHMGYAELYEYPMEGGVLTEERVLFTEEDVWDYTPVDEIVPGAEHIGYYYTQLGEYDTFKGYDPESEWHEYDDGRLHPAAGRALLLPIADWGDGPAPTGSSSERARAAILAALNGETKFYGACGDHFYGDVGWTTWEEYIQPNGAYPYNDEPLVVSAHAWRDMNGDGQEELLLQVVTVTGEDNGEPWAIESTVMLSEQDGTVYAYFFSLSERNDFCTDGAIRQYGETWRLSFWQDQCYEYIVPDTSAPAVKWVDGSPLD